MNAVQSRRYEMLVRVRDFGNAHADLFQESSLAQQTFAAVAEAVQQLNAHTVSKLSAVPGTTPKTMARADLHDRLETISQTARVIAEQTSDLEEKFVLPKVLSNQALLMTARAFAHDAEPIADRFIAHVMPKTFLADLEASIGRFELATHEREAGKDERIAAKARIEAAVTAGLAAVRALDAMVGNPRTPNADTVLQHARMYGYRRADVGVTRLFLPQRLADHFSSIHQMETALRDLLQRYPNGCFEGVFISGAWEPTRRNVLDPTSLGYYVAGASYNPSYPLRDESVRKKTLWLDGQLADVPDDGPFVETSIERILSLIQKCDADPSHPIQLWDGRPLKAALEMYKK